LRLLFAGTPDVAVPSLELLLASDHEVVAVLTGPMPAPAVAAGSAAPRSPSGPRPPACRLLQPRSLRSRSSSSSWPSSPSTAHPWWPTAPSCRRPRWVCRGSAGSTCTSRCSRPGVAPRRCSTRSWPATRSPAPRPSGWRRAWTPARSTAWSPSRSRPRDTAGDLLGRLAISGARLLVATLDGIAAGTLEPEPQPAEGVSLAPRIEPADARVDWSLPAHVVDRRVRGVTPAPGRLDDVARRPAAAGPGRAAAVVPRAAPGSCRWAPRACSSAPAGAPSGSGEVQPAGQAHAARRRLGPRGAAGARASGSGREPPRRPPAAGAAPARRRPPRTGRSSTAPG
jgi:methionyl-tRNA formyltransferase